jgi:hypothetical protein
MFTAKLPDAGIRFKFILVVADEFVQMHTGSFLLAFDDELDVAGNVAIGFKNCIERM